MTIWFKQDWNAYEAGDIANLPASVEAELVASGVAIDQAKIPQLTTTSSGNKVLVGPDGLPMIPSTAIDARAYGCKFDGQVLYNVTTTNSTTCQIVDSDANGLFAADDVGKVCSVVSTADAYAIGRWGTISSVSADGNSAVVALSAAPGALTGACFVWGTDDGAAMNTLLAAAQIRNQAVKLPEGIACTTVGIVQPDGVSVYGVGNTRHGGPAGNFRHTGSSVANCKYMSGNLWAVGDGSLGSIYTGTLCQGFNVDAMNQAGRVFQGSSRNTNMILMTGARPVGYAYNTGPGSETFLCTFFGNQSAGNLVKIGGDSRFTHNKVFGQGAGYHCIELASANDVKVLDNHMWQNLTSSASPGGGVLVTIGSSTTQGAVAISRNTMDSVFGPAVTIAGTLGGKIRALAIEDNISFKNSSVPANTYPLFGLTGFTSGTIYGLSIKGNTARGDWNDSAYSNATTKGSYTTMIDAAGMTGTVVGSYVGGNVISDCIGGAYTNFTPDIDGGNITITPAGVMTKTTIG